MDFFLNYSAVRWEALFLWANLAFLSGYAAWFPVRALAVRIAEAAPRRPRHAAQHAAVVVQDAPAPAPAEPAAPARAELTPDQRQKLQDAVVAAKSKVARGDWQAAQAKIVEGLSVDKLNPELNCMLAEQFERRLEWSKAEFVYRDLILATDSRDSSLFSRLAAVLEKQGKDALALEVWKKAFELRPDEAKPADASARLALGLGRWDEALRYAKESLRLFPRNARALDMLASANLALGDRRAALDAYLKIKELDPYDPAVRKTIERVTLEIEMEKNMTPAAAERASA